MIASFIHDECISRADINNPFTSDLKRKFTIKDISYPNAEESDDYNYYATVYLKDQKLGDIKLEPKIIHIGRK